MKTPNNKMKPLSLVETAEHALRRAVAKLIAEHKQTGEPLAIWRDGRVVMVPPDQLALREDPVDYRAKRR
jgi:hypothetical protein